MQESPFRKNAKLRIDLNNTAGYPLLISRPLGEVINSTRAAHQRFRFAQRWFPNPNGWAALGLVLMIAFTALLYLIPTIQGSGNQALAAVVTGILGLGGGVCLLLRSKETPLTIAALLYQLCASLLFPAFVTVDSFREKPHAVFFFIISATLVLSSFSALGQLLSLLLKHKNHGFWVSEAWETYSVQGFIKRTLTDLEPIQARLKRIAERITWLRGDIAKTEARLHAYKTADTSDLSAAEEVDRKRLERFSEELAELSPLHDTAQKHDKSIQSLLETLINVANEHRPTPDLHGTYEGEEKERALHTSTLSEYRKYLAAVEKAEATMRGIATVSSVAAAAVVPDDRDEDHALLDHQKATA